MVWWMIGAAAIAAGTLPAQVPPDIATKLIAIDSAGHDLKRGKFDLAAVVTALTELRR